MSIICSEYENVSETEELRASTYIATLLTYRLSALTGESLRSVTQPQLFGAKCCDRGVVAGCSAG